MEVHGAYQEWLQITFIRVLRDGKSCWFNFFMDMPVRLGSRQMPARCIHGDAGDNTDDPGAMIQDCSRCDPWMSKAPLKNVNRSRKTVTTVLSARTPPIKIRDDPCCNLWMCERPFTHNWSHSDLLLTFSASSSSFFSSSCAGGGGMGSGNDTLLSSCTQRKQLQGNNSAPLWLKEASDKSPKSEKVMFLN